MIQRLHLGSVARHQPPQSSDLAGAILKQLVYTVGVARDRATSQEWLLATAFAVRERIMDRWMDTARRTRGRKRVYYLSIEFLIGRLLFDALTNMQLLQPCRAALASFGVDLDELRACEPDAALGNGGLGRLAACYMDSMATLGIPAFGYGIRYEHGLFHQRFRDGWQEEIPDDWLRFGDPWEIERRRVTYRVPFGGLAESGFGSEGDASGRWHAAEEVEAQAFDTPIVGWRGHHVNTLRLWSACAVEPLHLPTFSRGAHIDALNARMRAEAISRVLYPTATSDSGRELRLRQEFFFTSASLQDIVAHHLEEHRDVSSLADYATIQMNDTHPAIAVAELMRILLDEHRVGWENAWSITLRTLNYTNHTLLPEALESWPVGLINRVLPRHLQIIHRLNWHHLHSLRPRDDGKPHDIAALSLIDETGEQRLRMGHLAFVGSSHVNGVSALHTRLMTETVFHDLAAAYPGRIVNKTNGITMRRWLFEANPRLTALLIESLGAGVLDHTETLRGLERFLEDDRMLARLTEIKQANKRDLGHLVRLQTGLQIDESALFDVHIKRIHEYKRQLLNILEAIALYNSIRAQPERAWTHRVKIFAGKAAMDYTQAKLIIKLINDVAETVNRDPAIGDRLKVIFLPDYSVSLAESIVPAADLSEQISTAGLEASGTGNMKLALNGVITIGTLDGANIEITDRVGADNIFIFGMTAEEVAAKRQAGFAGRDAAATSLLLADALNSIRSGLFSSDDLERFHPLVDRLLGHDEYMVAADFDAYWRTQRDIDRLWSNRKAWSQKSLLNTARMGWFSSDRAVREYADEIWNIELEARNP